MLRTKQDPKVQTLADLPKLLEYVDTTGTFNKGSLATKGGIVRNYQESCQTQLSLVGASNSQIYL